MTKLKLQIAHQTPGRVRMKVAAAKGNPEMLEQIASTFGVIPGIERVTTNPTTGSIVLHYDTDQHAAFHGRFHTHCEECMPVDRRRPTNEIDDLADKIQREAEFLAERSDSARVIVEFFKSADREIKLATDNVVDLKVLLAVGVVGFTVLEVGASAATPVWVTLAIFGLNHLVEAQPARHAAVAAAPRGAQAPA